MRNNRTVVGNAARELCEKFPAAGTRTLARMLLRDEPKLFKDFEHARTTIRRCRGEHGKHNRDRTDTVPTTKFAVAVPESEDKPVEPYVLTATGKGLVISDIHLPYHDRGAVEMTLQHALAAGHCDFCIVNGDLLDCYQLSRFNKDPRLKDFAGELKMAREFLTTLAGEFDKVIYKLGNHELRYEHYLQTKAAELIGVDEVELPNLLHLAEIGVEFVEDYRVIHAGKLNILHGHEYGRGMFSPVNPARGMFIRASACTLSGHLHRTSHHNEPDIRGKLISCWSTGCLCGLHPRYAVLNKWDHGFALMEFDGKDFELQTKRIVSGKVV